MARDESRYLLWLTEDVAWRFREDGWQELRPHRDGAVLFVHRAREQNIALAYGVDSPTATLETDDV